MKRLTDINLNTSEYFDNLYAIDKSSRYDPVYAEAFVKELPQEGTIMDVGCGLFGWGQYTILRNLRLKCNFILVDFSKYACETLADWIQRPNVSIIQHDIRDGIINYGADFVGSSEVIEHMEDVQGFVDKLFLMTKPGGKVMVGTVDADCKDAQKRTYLEHLYSFSPTDLAEMFSKHCKDGDAQFKMVGNYMTIRGIKK